MKEKSIKAQAEEIHKKHREDIKTLLETVAPDQKTLNALQSVLSNNGITIQSITGKLKIEKSDTMRDAIYSMDEQIEQDLPKLG